MTEQMNRIRELVVKDYFTPNIKAEVILDTFLTPYVAELLRNQSESSFGEELTYITKEMSVRESERPRDVSRYGKRGTKIDYVLGDEKAIYVVELKTTGSGMKPEQARRYLKNCQGKTFGQVLGNKLLNVMKGAFGKTCENNFPPHLQSDQAGYPMWKDDQALEDAFLSILNTWNPGEIYEMKHLSGHCAEKAMELIRGEGWTQSRKYLYTAGQLLDYLHEYPGRTLWDKDLRLIYLTPTGECPSEEFEKEEYKGFYIKPAQSDLHSFSLKVAGEYLEEKYLKEKPEDETALLLSGILKDIYLERKTK